MIISIRVIPNAGKNEIIKENSHLRIHLNAPPENGKANKLLIRMLADFFKTKKNDIRIIKGSKSREKIVEINNQSNLSMPKG